MNENRKRSPLNIIAGLVVIILVCVGVFSILGNVGGKISRRVSEKNEAQFSEYEAFISTVIMNDPDTFDDVSGANASQLISISIWALIEENLEPDTYEYIDGGILIPQKDVESKFTSLFGSDVKISHCTVDGGEGIEFRYSESKKGYIIPITGITPIYTPKVIDVKERENTVILTVGYLATEEWQQDSEGNMTEPEPSKYMEITLSKNQDGSHYVRAIRLV